MISWNLSAVMRKRALTKAVAMALSVCAAVIGPLSGSTATAANPEFSEPVLPPSIRLGSQAAAALREKHIERAQALAAEGLRLNPTDARLHLINAMCFHQRWFNGEITAQDFAKTGYDLALLHDPSLWPAAWLLGALMGASGDYRAAKEAYARALLIRRNHPELKLEFAQVAYLSGDAVAAYGTLSSMPDLVGKDPMITRALAITAASVGKYEQSEQLLRNLATAIPPVELEAVRQRTDDWRETLHLVASRTIATDGASPSPLPRPSQIETDTPIVLAQAGNSVLEQLMAQQQKQRVKVEAATAAPKPVPTAVETLRTQSTRMAMIDATILLTEESYTSGKGVNLLRGLQLMLGSADNSYLSRIMTGVSGQPGVTTNIRTVTIPQISYMLNIANTNDVRSEVLARPTLTVLDGKESSFSNGQKISIPLTGQFGGSLVDRDVGIQMTVTPTFITDQRLMLAVKVNRSFFTPVVIDANISQAFQVSDTSVTSNVALNFGETLILSGLTEKSSTLSADSTPGLSAIPILQYFFTRKTEDLATRSVLVLLTPRSTVNHMQINAATSTKPAENELRRRVPEWFKIEAAPNWVSVMTQLQTNQFYHQYRKSDLFGEKFDLFNSIPAKIQRALGFLYF